MSEIKKEQAQAALNEFNNMDNGCSNTLCAMTKALEVYEANVPQNKELKNHAKALAVMLESLTDDFESGGSGFEKGSLGMEELFALRKKSRTLGLLG